MFSMESFSDWLLSELKSRKMSQSDLAHDAGLGRGTISNIMNGTRNVGQDTLIAIAHGLHLSRETVFRAAGLLPPTTDDPWVDEQAYRLKNLTGSRRSMAESLLKSLEEQEIQAAQEAEAANRKLRPVER
jgi:transcriptional regulator with XRE-family HTH domain